MFDVARRHHIDLNEQMHQHLCRTWASNMHIGSEDWQSMRQMLNDSQGPASPVDQYIGVELDE
jgi:hypothetical protein